MAQTIKGPTPDPPPQPVQLPDPQPVGITENRPVGVAETAPTSEVAAPARVAGGRRPASRRTRVVIRRVGPLSVLKFSLVFYFCVMLIFFLGLVFLYGIMSAIGVIDGIEDLIPGLGLSKAEKGAFRIDAGWLFTRVFVVGCAMVVVWSLINVVASLLYNLISDIVGGVEVTLAEKR
jgi:hypothetical protein